MLIGLQNAEPSGERKAIYRATTDDESIWQTRKT